MIKLPDWWINSVKAKAIHFEHVFIKLPNLNSERILAYVYNPCLFCHYWNIWLQFLAFNAKN